MKTLKSVLESNGVSDRYKMHMILQNLNSLFADIMNGVDEFGDKDEATSFIYCFVKQVADFTRNQKIQSLCKKLKNKLEFSIYHSRIEREVERTINGEDYTNWFYDYGFTYDVVEKFIKAKK